MDAHESESFELSRAYLRPTTYYQPGKVDMLHPLGGCRGFGTVGAG